jgi:hypothetical protein
LSRNREAASFVARFLKHRALELEPRFSTFFKHNIVLSEV